MNPLSTRKDQPSPPSKDDKPPRRGGPTKTPKYPTDETYPIASAEDIIEEGTSLPAIDMADGATELIPMNINYMRICLLINM
jgi:hypothetical protein